MISKNYDPAKNYPASPAGSAPVSLLPRRNRPPVAYDRAGNPVPTDLRKHLIAAELPDEAYLGPPDEEFFFWLDGFGAAEDERWLRKLCVEAH